MDATISHDPFLPDSEVEEVDTSSTGPHDHTQDKNSIAATRKLLGRKAMADHKKRVADVAS